ncbi:MAG: NAD(+)/NADH kinase, partial [Cellvibrionaceae bacterium]|nr:NAD(+)/NADH kinase [Cellvibrionaceae bacterium]
MAAQTLRLGFLLNPYAGLGGPLGLKGSDKLNAEHKTAPSRARERAKRTLQPLLARAGQLQLSSAPGPMGSDLLKQLGLPHRVLGKLAPGACHAEDSERLAAELAASGIDLLVFVGGDGTARNIVNGLGETFARQACLGIPAGVKMHSAVFAINPEAATGVIELLLDSGLVDIASQEVRDIDEDKFRQGVVRSKYYGELQVPALGQFVQTTKNSGREDEELVLADIGAY